jgi:positive regulator of sigma E activity
VVELELAEAKGCKGCEGLCLWRRLPEAVRERFRSDGNLEVGQEVRVSLPAHCLLRGTLLLHGLPLAALLLGGVAGQWLLRSDWGALLGALAGVLAVLAAGPRLRRRVEQTTLDAIRVERSR